MDDTPNRRTLSIVAGFLVVGGLLFSILMLGGGQTSTILSTVGAAIGPTTVGEPPVEPGPTAKPVSGGQVADAGAVVPTLLIVRTGTLELEVSDIATAVRGADAAVTRAGGYVSGSNLSADGADRLAETTYRIPSAAWQSTLDTLHGLASRVRSEEIKTDEVTGQVVDLAARIANLRATESALQAIMAKANRISDVLDVQEQLTSTRGEIERLVGDREHLQDQASYGSLTIAFRLPPTPAPTVTPKPVKGWDPAADVANATGKLVGIGQATTTAGIWLAIVGLPLLVGASVLLFVGWQVVRLGRWILSRRETAADAV
jgi:hypothetical protein